MLLGVFNGLTKNIKHFSFFKEEIIIINTKFSFYLNPLILKNKVYLIRQWQRVRELSGF